MSDLTRTVALQFVTEADGLIPLFSGAWWIRRGTHSRFSHVDVVLPDGNLLGARNDYHVDVDNRYSTGVRVRPADYAAFTVRERLVIPVSLVEEDKFLDFVHRQIGRPYDPLAVAAFVTGRDWRSPHAWFCSELVAAGLEHAGIVAILTPENKVTPNDAYLLAGAAGGTRQLWRPSRVVESGTWVADDAVVAA